MTSTPQRDPVRPGPLEAATAWMHGVSPPTPLPEASGSARSALETIIREALATGPCYVMFSGGRDSSVILAVAARVARRDGLPPPIPVTRVYPRYEESDERSWQELVIRHLDLSEWVTWEFGDEHDLLGPSARASLRRHGVLWPAALHVQRSLYQRLGTGHVLSGEGGDEVLGPRRGAAVTALLDRRRRPSRAEASAAVRAALPAPARRMLIRRAGRDLDPLPWLHRSTWHRHLRLLAEDEATTPRRWDRATWHVASKRAWQVAQHNDSVVAHDVGVASSHPLLDRDFLAALARQGGRRGWSSRTEVMLALFDDVLPEALLRRRTKASFNRAYRGPDTIEFARNWDGSGVDRSLVDSEALREQWLGDRPTFSAAVLLHQAWLASQPLAGDQRPTVARSGP